MRCLGSFYLDLDNVQPVTAADTGVLQRFFLTENDVLVQPSVSFDSCAAPDWCAQVEKHYNKSYHEQHPKRAARRRRPHVTMKLQDNFQSRGNVSGNLDLHLSLIMPSEHEDVSQVTDYVLQVTQQGSKIYEDCLAEARKALQALDKLRKRAKDNCRTPLDVELLEEHGIDGATDGVSALIRLRVGEYFVCAAFQSLFDRCRDQTSLGSQEAHSVRACFLGKPDEIRSAGLYEVEDLFAPNSACQEAIMDVIRASEERTEAQGSDLVHLREHDRGKSQDSQSQLREWEWVRRDFVDDSY